MKTNDIRQKNESSPARRADPADVESIDAIVTAAYDGISGPAGKKRDWDRERSLYFPGARLIPTAMKAGGPPSRGSGVAREHVDLAPQILGIDGFIARVEPFFEKMDSTKRRSRGAPNSLATSPMSGAFMSRATTKTIPNRLCPASIAFSYSMTESAGGS
jgi:hypothetical protein